MESTSNIIEEDKSSTKYKNTILNGITLNNLTSETYSNNVSIEKLDEFLDNENRSSTEEAWCKLNKTIKTQKFIHFVENYRKKNDLTEEESKILMKFLKECLDRKKLQRVKDVIYDKETGTIKEIPALCYLKSNKHFTLKNIDKRVSTLKSLAPKKCNKNTRKKDIQPSIDSDEEI